MPIQKVELPASAQKASSRNGTFSRSRSALTLQDFVEGCNSDQLRWLSPRARRHEQYHTRRAQEFAALASTAALELLRRGEEAVNDDLP